LHCSFLNDRGDVAMKKLTTFAISAAALTGIAVADVDASFYTGVHSDYVFRGVDLSEEEVFYDFGVDVSGSCDCGLDWYAGLWYAAVDGSDNNPTSFGAPDELDIFAGVSKDFGFGTVEIGYIAYTFSGDLATGNDAEAFIGFSTTLSGIDLGVTTYIGTEGIWNSGVWVDLYASYEFYGFGLDLNLGFAGGSAIGSDDVDGLATLSASLGYDIAISDDISLSPYLSLVINTDDYRDATGTDANDFFGGATLSFAF